MRRRWFVGCVLATLVVAFVPASQAGAAQSRSGYVVVLKGSAGAASAQARRASGAFGARVSHVYSHALSGYSATLTPAGLAALKADPSVAAVVPDRTLHI